MDHGLGCRVLLITEATNFDQTAVERGRDSRQEYLADKNPPPPVGPYISPMPRDLW
jgi:hypothetical protein